MSDLISRQQAIDALRAMQTYKLFAGDDMLLIDQAGAMTELMMLPSAQPERTPMQELLDVTADRDYWKAQCHSYEMTINRLTESAQSEIIRCKDCKYWVPGYITDNDDFIPPKCGKWQQMVGHSSDDYCSLAERREDG